MCSRLLAALVLSATTCSVPSSESAPRREGAEPRPLVKGGPHMEINAAVLRSLTAELAHDSYEGRGTGTPGGRRATEMIASQMKARGLDPSGEGFMQPLLLLGSTLGNVSLRWAKGKRSSELEGFIAHSESPNGHHEWRREMVFVGYGIDTVPDWDDYAGIDVTDTVVIALVGEPDVGPFRDRPRSSAGRWTSKLESARAHGAAGCMVVHTADAGYDWSVVQASFSGKHFDLAPPPTSPLTLRGWLSSAPFAQLTGKTEQGKVEPLIHGLAG
ncbi:MAG: hypothetical protein KUG77_12350, partial [Nannocystaceae bacterium]|nr:hypothetical protein [Nannocystaceae bacterium]